MTRIFADKTLAVRLTWLLIRSTSIQVIRGNSIALSFVKLLPSNTHSQPCSKSRYSASSITSLPWRRVMLFGFGSMYSIPIPLRLESSFRISGKSRFGKNRLHSLCEAANCSGVYGEGSSMYALPKSTIKGGSTMSISMIKSSLSVSTNTGTCTPEISPTPRSLRR